MKVELKLSQEQIIFLSGVLDHFIADNRQKFVAASRKEKAVYTICLDVRDKVNKKCFSFDRSHDKKKLLKMSFKYHEAHAISFFVDRLKDGKPNNEEDVYFISVAQNIYNQLDQKLS